MLTGNNEKEIQLLKQYLSIEFEIKDLGELKYFLGTEVARSQKGTFICQKKYSLVLLDETGMIGAEPVETPMEQNHGLCFDSAELLDDPSIYQRLVGVGKCHIPHRLSLELDVFIYLFGPSTY